MDFLTLAETRYSVRSFDRKPVPEDIVKTIIRAGLVAPTACNKQPQRIIAVSTEDGITRLKKCTECHYDAPLAFIIGYDEDQCWKRRCDGKTSGDIDASIAAAHMMLEAADLGIGSTWVMYFIPEAVKEEFSLPASVEPTAILVMGYPAEGCTPSPLHTSKKSPEEIVSYR